MSGWKSISIRYGGYWDDNLSYIGGGQSTSYVKRDDIRISELRGNINYFMVENSLSTSYQLYYLSISRGGRIIKSLLSSDDDLARACNDNADLEVYVIDDVGTSQSEQGVYRPSFEIHEAAKTYPAEVTPEALRKIRVEMESSRRYQVVAVNECTFKVKSGNKAFKVDLSRYTCSCKEWEMDRIPCSHAIAVIRQKGDRISQYVGVYYEAGALVQAYSYRVQPVRPIIVGRFPKMSLVLEFCLLTLSVRLDDQSLDDIVDQLRRLPKLDGQIQYMKPRVAELDQQELVAYAGLIHTRVKNTLT